MSRDFIINFGALPLGTHEFEFEVNDAFFQQFENSIIQKGHFDVLVVVEKKENVLFIDFTSNGEAKIPCDRCLEEMVIELEGYNELVVKLSDHNGEESEDVIVLDSKEYELDLSQFIYEYLTVMIPLRNVHEDYEQECDPEIIHEMEKHLHNEEETKPSNDPRWDGLKNINLN